MAVIDERIKTIKWAGLGLLILLGLSIKLYLTFSQLSRDFSRIEKYALTHLVLHSTTLDVSSDESVAETLATWTTNFHHSAYPADVTILEIIDSVPKKKEVILFYDFDMAGRCVFSFLKFESSDSSNQFFKKMEFLNDVREIDIDFLAIPYLGNDYLCRIQLQNQETQREYLMVIASARRDALQSSSNPSRYVYFVNEGVVTPYAAEELPALILQIAEEFNVSADEPKEAYKLVRTKWKNQSISIPVLNLDVPVRNASFLLFGLAFSYSLLLCSNLRRLSEAEVNQQNESWIVIEQLQPVSAFAIGKFSFWLESFLSKTFYLCIVLSPLAIGILCIFMWFETGYDKLYFSVLFFLISISLIPTISSLYYLRAIVKKSANP